jgi:hypothetical protein
MVIFCQFGWIDDFVSRFSPDARRDLDGVANPVQHKRFNVTPAERGTGLQTPSSTDFFDRNDLCFFLIEKEPQGAATGLIVLDGAG